MSRNQRLIDDIKQFIAAFPRRHRVFINVVATVDYDEVKQLAHQIQHDADRYIRDTFCVLELSGAASR